MRSALSTFAYITLVISSTPYAVPLLAEPIACNTIQSDAKFPNTQPGGPSQSFVIQVVSFASLPKTSSLLVAIQTNPNELYCMYLFSSIFLLTGGTRGNKGHCNEDEICMSGPEDDRGIPTVASCVEQKKFKRVYDDIYRQVARVSYCSRTPLI